MTMISQNKFVKKITKLFSKHFWYWQRQISRLKGQNRYRHTHVCTNDFENLQSPFRGESQFSIHQMMFT